MSIECKCEFAETPTRFLARLGIALAGLAVAGRQTIGTAACAMLEIEPVIPTGGGEALARVGEALARVDEALPPVGEALAPVAKSWHRASAPAAA